MTADPYREWDAAYVLGALAPAERRDFETHLAGCAQCRAAVGELAGVPGLLAMVPPDVALALPGEPAGASAAPGARASSVGGDDGSPAADAGAGAQVVPLARVAAAARHRRARRRFALVGAAAALVVLGGVAGSAVTSATAPRPAAVAADARTVALTPVGGSGVTADLTLVPAGWGTRLDWSCAYEAAELPVGVYEMVLVGDDGERTVVATWTSTGEREASGLGASSALPLDGIARVELGVVGMDRPLAAGEV
ncbi:anti-sigma factor family protein [Cellulomonas iranensis]|uniref:anti-sigma factor family protein n=1 Tax=Cellulomonas iranensis TaxID=76862 RepID=UPI003D7CFBD5